MTNFENHRTASSYEDALIVKTFAFRFLNNYLPLFYVAFVKPFIPDFDKCTDNNCLKELQITLGTIFISKLMFNLVMAVFYPLYLQRRRQRNAFRGLKATDLKLMSSIERIYVKGDYDAEGGTLEDYLGSVILFGYTTMFISAFPLATVMALLNNYIEMRLLAWQLCYIYRRPMPRGAQDIGIYYSIMEIMTTAAAVVNAGLIAFTRPNSAGYSGVILVWIFVLISVGVLLIKYVVAVTIPDTPLFVRLQLQRQNFIVSKVIDDEPDDDSWMHDFAELNGGGGTENSEGWFIDIQDTDAMGAVV